MRVIRLIWGVLLISAMLVFLSYSPSYAVEESITITTYYPSPSGAYNELTANRIAVGYADATGISSRDGAIRFKPITDPLHKWTPGQEGEFAYSATAKSMYLFNGSSWVQQGGGKPLGPLPYVSGDNNQKTAQFDMASEGEVLITADANVCTSSSGYINLVIDGNARDTVFIRGWSVCFNVTLNAKTVLTAGSHSIQVLCSPTAFFTSTVGYGAVATPVDIFVYP